MLQDYYKDGKITRSQLYLTNLANQLPAFFAHLPTTFFMVVPITRWAGTLYFILTFLAAILRMACVLIYGHFRLPQENDASDGASPAIQPAAPRNSKPSGRICGKNFPPD